MCVCDNYFPRPYRYTSSLGKEKGTLSSDKSYAQYHFDAYFVRLFSLSPPSIQRAFTEEKNPLSTNNPFTKRVFLSGKSAVEKRLPKRG